MPSLARKLGWPGELKVEVAQELANGPFLLAALLYRNGNAIVREMDRRLYDQHDVTFVQALVLISIAATPAAQPHTIAAALDQQPQSLTSMLDRLERAGLLRRVRDLEDRRAIRLELTEEGVTIVESARVDLSAHLERVFSKLSPQDTIHLTELLTTVHSTLSSTTSIK